MSAEFQDAAGGGRKRRVQGGLLVVVEGVDGVGKSTVLQRLAEFCEVSGYEWVRSREPTDGPWGRKIRSTSQTGRLSLEEELELFVRDRQEHVEHLIRPALERGLVVLLDRYYFSTAAYQGARGADPEAILQANERFAPRPDVVLLLDCDPVVTLERIRGRGGAPDAFEHLEALQAVRRIFLSIRRPGISVVDASGNAASVAERCVAQLREALGAKNGVLGG